MLLSLKVMSKYYAALVVLCERTRSVHRESISTCNKKFPERNMFKIRCPELQQSDKMKFCLSTLSTEDDLDLPHKRV